MLSNLQINQRVIEWRSGFGSRAVDIVADYFSNTTTFPTPKSIANRVHYLLGVGRPWLFENMEDPAIVEVVSKFFYILSFGITEHLTARVRTKRLPPGPSRPQDICTSL